MCDFKPGDEVCYAGLPYECEIREDHQRNARINRGDIVVIMRVSPWKDSDLFGVVVSGFDGWFDSRVFRKVQRRDLTEWLSTAVKNTDHIDKRKSVTA